MEESPFDKWIQPKTLALGLGILVTITFLPLLRYFFSQDDFYLIHRAIHEPVYMLKILFGPAGYHFRPLTKFGYFYVMWHVFGLHALPYHIVSLVVHIGNSALIYMLLRRLRVAAAPAIVCTGLFALNVSYFNAVGWITAIQQLMGALFMLLALTTGIAALEERTARKQMLSAAMYLLAVLAYEQPFLAPVLLAMIAVVGLAGQRRSLWTTVRVLWPQLLLMALYIANRLWKGVPDRGTSRIVIGPRNLTENLKAYLGGFYDFWPTILNMMQNPPPHYNVSHLILAALVVYHLLRRRWWAVLFALAFILLTLAPALFLVRHYFYYHTYVPALGALYLLALALQDVFALARRVGLGSQRRQVIVAVGLVVAITPLSAVKVRQNERRALDDKTKFNASYVVRRAVYAEHAYRDLMAKAGDMSGVKKINLIYGWPGKNRLGGENGDVWWAFSEGRAISLFFHSQNPDIETVFVDRTARPERLVTEDSRVFFYDYNGHIYTMDEVMEGRER